jgi:hypothetical protein
MPKNDVRRPKRRLTPLPTGQTAGEQRRRLEGDDLFVWATLHSELRQAQNRVQEFIGGLTQRYGLTEHQGIDPMGYIVSRRGQPIPIQVEAEDAQPEGEPS